MKTLFISQLIPKINNHYRSLPIEIYFRFTHLRWILVHITKFFVYKGFAFDGSFNS